MISFRRVCCAIVLATAFAFSTLAGETNSPPCANPGETSSPPCSDSITGETQTPPGDGHGPGISANEPGDGHSPGFAVLGDVSTPGFANTLFNIWGLF